MFHQRIPLHTDLPASANPNSSRNDSLYQNLHPTIQAGPPSPAMVGRTPGKEPTGTATANTSPILQCGMSPQPGPRVHSTQWTTYPPRPNLSWTSMEEMSL